MVMMWLAAAHFSSYWKFFCLFAFGCHVLNTSAETSNSAEVHNNNQQSSNKMVNDKEDVKHNTLFNMAPLEANHVNHDRKARALVTPAEDDASPAANALIHHKRSTLRTNKTPRSIAPKKSPLLTMRPDQTEGTYWESMAENENLPVGGVKEHPLEMFGANKPRKKKWSFPYRRDQRAQRAPPGRKSLMEHGQLPGVKKMFRDHRSIRKNGRLPGILPPGAFMDQESFSRPTKRKTHFVQEQSGGGWPPAADGTPAAAAEGALFEDYPEDLLTLIFLLKEAVADGTVEELLEKHPWLGPYASPELLGLISTATDMGDYEGALPENGGSLLMGDGGAGLEWVFEDQYPSAVDENDEGPAMEVANNQPWPFGSSNFPFINPNTPPMLDTGSNNNNDAWKRGYGRRRLPLPTNEILSALRAISDRAGPSSGSRPAAMGLIRRGSLGLIPAGADVDGVTNPANIAAGGEAGQDFSRSMHRDAGEQQRLMGFGMRQVKKRSSGQQPETNGENHGSNM